MKIYITGSVGSGKTTLARRLSKATGIACHPLDEVVYIEDPSDSWGNTKRPEEERNALFAAILSAGDFIMEDAGRACFLEGILQADTLVLLEPPLALRKMRLILRWTKQNLGLEKSLYKPRLDVLKAMFRWLDNYESDKDGTKTRIAPFREKTVTLRTRRDIRNFISQQQKSISSP